MIISLRYDKFIFSPSSFQNVIKFLPAPVGFLHVSDSVDIIVGSIVDDKSGGGGRIDVEKSENFLMTLLIKGSKFSRSEKLSEKLGQSNFGILEN